MSLAVPEEPADPFQGVNHVSNFARSGVLVAYRTRDAGLDRSPSVDVRADSRRRRTSLPPAGKPPHIILMLDEASFDITAAPGIKVPPGYQEPFPLVRRQGAHVRSSKAPAGRPGTPNTTC